MILRFTCALNSGKNPETDDLAICADSIIAVVEDDRTDTGIKIAVLYTYLGRFYVEDDDRTAIDRWKVTRDGF